MRQGTSQPSSTARGEDHAGAVAPWPLVWTTMSAVGLVASVGVGCALLDAEQRVLVGATTLAAAAGMGVVLWQLGRRGRAVRALEHAATRMLAADLPSSLEHAPARTGDLPNLPRELVPLRNALDGLAGRMRAQLKEVAKKSRNLESLIDAMDEPLLVTNDEDRVILCSRSAEKIVDAAEGGLSGRSIRDVFTNSEILEMHQAAKAGEVRRRRVRVVTPLGLRTFQVTATPVPAAWGEGVFGAVLTLRDVTELDQAVQVKTDFVANASHELRTPVAAIRSAAETLEAAAGDAAMSARLRGMIVSHAERLEEMLRDLLDLSRLESPDMPLTIEAIDLGALERTLRNLSEQACAERRLALSFEFDEELRGMRTDRKVLTLILRNLVENATKFAHEGTTIRVRGEVVEEEPAAAGPRRVVVRFEVVDQGVGIPLAHQERVFERYYQVDTARTGTGSGTGWKRGTGLGLAIVKHAAKALGGRTGLTSVWGQGTAVFAEFPCEIGQPAGVADRAGGEAA
jgi:two-component system phosphate regulon sensor histidine kinase PhoR